MECEFSTDWSDPQNLKGKMLPPLWITLKNTSCIPAPSLHPCLSAKTLNGFFHLIKVILSVCVRSGKKKKTTVCLWPQMSVCGGIKHTHTNYYVTALEPMNRVMAGLQQRRTHLSWINENTIFHLHASVTTNPFIFHTPTPPCTHARRCPMPFSRTAAHPSPPADGDFKAFASLTQCRRILVCNLEVISPLSLSLFSSSSHLLAPSHELLKGRVWPVS